MVAVFTIKMLFKVKDTECTHGGLLKIGVQLFDNAGFDPNFDKLLLSVVK